ncbi:MAG: hypothetical protein PUB18_04840 [bacterium]|nr:hypothetical protein [bacterium]
MKKKPSSTKKKILNFLKQYLGILTFLLSGIGLILNIGIWYYQQCRKTDFLINYYIQKININQQEANNAEIKKHLSYETVNNDLNQIIRKFKDELKDYYVTYLILEQYQTLSAEQLTLILKNKSHSVPEEFKELDLETKEKVQEFHIRYTIPQNSGIKIPISICKYEEQTMKKLDCLFKEYEPLSIHFKNKYLLSRQRKEVREIVEDLVVFENEIINGKGSEAPTRSTKKWFQK